MEKNTDESKRPYLHLFNAVTDLSARMDLLSGMLSQLAKDVKRMQQEAEELYISENEELR